MIFDTDQSLNKFLIMVMRCGVMEIEYSAKLHMNFCIAQLSPSDCDE